MLISHGRVMAQVVILWPFGTEAQVSAQVSPCGICGGQSGTPSSSVSPVNIILPWPSILMYNLEDDLEAAFQRCSLTSST
jgi:hypothetical protein